MNKDTTTEAPILLGDGQAARLLGVTARRVRKLRETRQIDRIKVVRLTRIEPSAIRRNRKSQRQPALGRRQLAS